MIMILLPANYAKVVDMFGCRLPVAAVSFPALPELVQDGVTGRVFSSSSQLAAIIQVSIRLVLFL